MHAAEVVCCVLKLGCFVHQPCVAQSQEVLLGGCWYFVESTNNHKYETSERWYVHMALCTICMSPSCVCHCVQCFGLEM